MKPVQISVQILFSLLVAFVALPSYAQSAPTATQQLQLSGFAAATGTFTGLRGGKNFAFTGGIDLTYLPLRKFRPSIELRGTYPIDEGTISSQKDILAGVKVEHPLGRFHPYGDFLIGRGEIDYGMGGYPLGNLLFISSTSTVYSPGVGLDYELSRHFALKGDVQFQHWDTPVVPSGVIHPIPVSFGVIYNFDFNRRSHHRH